MNDKEKKPEDEQSKDEQTPEAPTEAPQETPQDAAVAAQKAEGSATPAEEEAPAQPPTEAAQTADKPPELSEADKLREENFRLKTQLEAMKAGFTPDTIEDAVVLAENIVKKDGSDIAAALKAVAKKYPDWASAGADADKGGKSGFRVGVAAPDKQQPNDDKISRAFGLKKKG